MSALGDIGDEAPRQVWEGISARIVEGTGLTLAVVELDPDVPLPDHSHANEQLGIVLEGELTFRIGEETQTLRPGGTWRIPPNVRHSGRTGPDGAVVIDVFSPAREDWRALQPQEPRPARWPG